MKQEVSPAGADDVVYRPSTKAYPRQPQVVMGVRHHPKFDLVEFSMTKVADAAQIYADFSGKEVRVSGSLVDREFRHLGASVADQVTRVVEAALPAAGIEIVHLSSSLVAWREGESAQERAIALRQAIATPEQVTAAEKAMSVDNFWTLIENARRTGGTDELSLAIALQAALGRLSADEIFGFQLRLNERLDESYRWDLWAVAYIVNGGASNDGFEYFCGWLIAQGRQYFEAAMKDPEKAANRAGVSYDNENEEILYAAMQAYQEKTGKLPPTLPSRRPSEPKGSRWTEADLPKLYPKLTEKFD